MYCIHDMKRSNFYDPALKMGSRMRCTAAQDGMPKCPCKKLVPVRGGAYPILITEKGIGCDGWIMEWLLDSDS